MSFDRAAVAQRPPRQYAVYVIELDTAAAPSSDRLPLYVGETALSPELRFARHREGGRTASRVVHQFGIRLRADLSAGVGPFATREEAAAAELRLAENLRSRGFVVFGGQGRTFQLSSGAVGGRS